MTRTIIAARRNPLRRVLGVLQPTARLRDEYRVRLACGHNGWAREGQRRAGCRDCRLEATA